MAERTREDRLRGIEGYRRVESAQELEADIGTLRALGSHAGPLRAWIILAAMFSFALSLCVGYSLLVAYPNEPAALLVPIGIGLCIAVAVLTKLRIVTKAQLDKLDVASSLVRRLEFAPGSPVSLALELAGSRPQNQQSLSPPFGLPSWRESFNRCYADGWLTLEGTLSNGVSIRITRCSYSLQRVSRDRNGNDRTLHTAYAFEDRVELSYQPSENPSLPELGTTLSTSLRLAPGCVLTTLHNQPGALSLVTMTEPREAATNHSSELVALVSQALVLVAPSRSLLRAEREALLPAQDLVVMRRGALGQLTRDLARPNLKLVGAALLLLGALGLGVLAYYQHGHVEYRQESAHEARKQQQDNERKLGAAVGASAEYQAELKTKIASDKGAAAKHDAEASEERKLELAELAGTLLCLAGSCVLLVLGLRRKAAPLRTSPYP